MFPKTKRLSRSEFETWFKHGKRHHFKHLFIITTPSPKQKVAVVVGKKVVKQAVRRNTLRRQVYGRLHQLLSPASYQGVFIVVLKPSYNTLSKGTADRYLQQSVAEVLKST